MLKSLKSYVYNVVSICRGPQGKKQSEGSFDSIELKTSLPKYLYAY